MPTLKKYAKETDTPVRRRWSEVYKDRREISMKSSDESQYPAMDEIFSNPENAWEQSIQKCVRAIERWWYTIPELSRYGADVMLEKRLRPDFALPPAPKPSLIPATSKIRPDLQARVVAEGINVAGSAERPIIVMRDILNKSHFSNDPGSWSIVGEDESDYRVIPRTLMVELLDAYPNVGKANSATEAVLDTLAWFCAHGVTAVGQIYGRGRYALIIVQESNGEMNVVCYDPHNYKRIVDPDFRATPEEVHSGKYSGYREGPYDTKYGSVFI